MQTNQNWTIDYSHTKVGFSVKHFGITETDGFFRKFSATVNAEKEDFSDLAVKVVVPIDSVDTNDTQRDAHLKAADFFNAEVYPEMKFESTGLETTQHKNEYKLKGNLTIRNVTKEVSFDLIFSGIVPQDPYGNIKAGFLLTGSINRQEFGLTFNILLGTGDLAVSDTVKIKIPIQIQKPANS